MASIYKHTVKSDFTILGRLFLKDDVIYISDSIYTMNGLFDYRRDIFDDSRKMLGSIRDSHYYKSVKYHLN